MYGSADTARIRATAGVVALGLLAGACAGANKTGAAGPTATQPRSYAIGPIGPGLASGDPGALTRWQNRMAEDMRRGRPAPVRPQSSASTSRSAAPGTTSPARAPAGRSVGLGSPNVGGAQLAISSGGAGLTSGLASSTGPASAAAESASPLLSRATLNAPAVRRAAVAAEAARGGPDVRWLWAVVAASLAALFYLLARAFRARRATEPAVALPLAPGPARIQHPRRPVFKPGPPPPRVTVLASARR